MSQEQLKQDRELLEVFNKRHSLTDCIKWLSKTNHPHQEGTLGVALLKAQDRVTKFDLASTLLAELTDEIDGQCGCMVCKMDKIKHSLNQQIRHEKKN